MLDPSLPSAVPSLMRRQYPAAVLYISAAVITFFFPLSVSFLPFLWKIIAYSGCAGVLAVFRILQKKQTAGQLDDPARPALLWLLIIHLYYPVAVFLEWVLPFSFLGVSYLPVTIVLTVLLLTAPSWKPHGKWFRTGSFTGGTVILILLVAVFSGAALYLWQLLLQPDLSDFFSMMPSGGAVLLLLAGFGFAVTNAFVEEMFFRGFFWYGLEGKKVLQVVVTALLFGFLHIRGFPGGAVGVGMVFVWGLFLALLRRRTGGMLAPYIAHVVADMTIFGILCGLYY